MDGIERKFRLNDTDWAHLVGIAQRLVRDSDMPNGSKPSDPRIGPLLRLIARGEIVVYRPKPEEEPT